MLTEIDVKHPELRVDLVVDERVSSTENHDAWGRREGPWMTLDDDTTFDRFEAQLRSATSKANLFGLQVASVFLEPNNTKVEGL